LLGIFQGKKAEYNKLILKSLVGGSKTTTQIAEYIYLNRRNQMKLLKLNKNRVKTIVSIVSKKGSRLDELRTKHYIKRKNNLWHLTAPKGYAVALTLVDDVREVWRYVQIDDLSAFLDKLHEIPIIDDFISNEKLKKVESFGMSPKFLQSVRDCTSELITQGVDLDGMNELEFDVLLTGKVTYVILRDIFELSGISTHK